MQAGKSAIVLVLAAGIACAGVSMGQSGWQPGPHGIGFGAPKAKQWVELVSSPQVAVKATSPSAAAKDVELRFTIQQGLHMNFHRPHSEFLIPTTLTLEKTLAWKLLKSSIRREWITISSSRRKMRSGCTLANLLWLSACTRMPVTMRSTANCIIRPATTKPATHRRPFLYSWM